VTLAGQRLSAVHANLQGRRNAHTLTLDASMPDWRVTARLAGGLDERQVCPQGVGRACKATEASTTTLWRGQLTQATAQGPWPMQLMGAATLRLSREQQQVSSLALTLAGGRLTVEQFSRQGAQLASRGSLANLPLAPLLALLETEPPFTTDLRVNGDWDLRAGTTLDGKLRLRRQSGDVRTNEPAQSLGLTTLVLDLDAEASRVTARVEAASREAGQLRAGGRRRCCARAPSSFCAQCAAGMDGATRRARPASGQTLSAGRHPAGCAPGRATLGSGSLAAPASMARSMPARFVLPCRNKASPSPTAR